MLVEALIPEFAVKALNIGALGRLSRLDKVKLDLRPGIHRLADECQPIADADDFGQPPGQCGLLQNPCDALTG